MEVRSGVKNNNNLPPPVKTQKVKNDNNLPVPTSKPAPSTPSKREASLNLDADFDFGILPGKRASVDLDISRDGGVSFALPPLKRDTVDLNALTDQISNPLSDEFSQGQGEVSNDIGYGSKRGLGKPFIPTTAKPNTSIPKSTGKPPRP